MSETELSRSFSSLTLSSNGISNYIQKSEDYSNDSDNETESQIPEISREYTQSTLNSKDDNEDSANIDSSFISGADDYLDQSRSSTLTSDQMSVEEKNLSSRESTIFTAQGDLGLMLEKTSDIDVTYDETEDGQSFLLDKESSVLIERDGKFELVSPLDLKANEASTFKDKQRKLKTKINEKTSVNENVVSSYALTEAQMEMKKKRISVRNMRLNEEKQRRKEEEERQHIENEKSYKKWLLQKSSKSNKKKTKSENSADEEKMKMAEKSFQDWLKQKEISKKEEKKIEKVRLADEAEHYIVRDRAACEKSFKQWLKQKKIEENQQKSVNYKRLEQKKLNARNRMKPATAVYRTKKEEFEPVSTFTKSNKTPVLDISRSMAKIERMSKIRYCETFGYQHPAAYSDILI